MSDSLLALAMTAAQVGGEVLRFYIGRLEAGEIEEKGQNDWVSAADRKSEAVIAAFLHPPQPPTSACSPKREECVAAVAPSGSSTRSTARRTSSARFPTSPCRSAWWRTECRSSARSTTRCAMSSSRRRAGAARSATGARLRVSGRERLDGAFVTTGFPFRVLRHIDTYLAVFRAVYCRAAAIRRPGSAALDLAHTAAGIFDGFFEFNLSPWDIAAGAVIVREAGGTVTDLNGDDEIFARGNVLAATRASTATCSAWFGRSVATTKSPDGSRPHPRACRGNGVGRVTGAAGHYARRRDEGDVPPSPRSGNAADGPAPPVTRRAQGDCGRMLRRSSSAMEEHRPPPRSLPAARKPLRATLPVSPTRSWSVPGHSRGNRSDSGLY